MNLRGLAKMRRQFLPICLVHNVKRVVNKVLEWSLNFLEVSKADRGERFGDEGDLHHPDAAGQSARRYGGSFTF